MASGSIHNHETIQLDGETFEDCEFRSCRLIYAGGEPPLFTDCRFDECEWRFEDAAARTLAHLKLVWSLGAKADIQAVIKAITGAGR